MKNHNSRSPSFKISPSILLQASKSEDRLQYKTDLLQYPFAKKSINEPQQKLREQIKICQWRLKTEFPIVKVKTLNYIQKNYDHDPLLKITIEDVKIRLTQLHDLPLFKIMYLLKEALIGFERLFHKFGSFLPTPDMVALNNQHRCMVWLNQDFSLNQPSLVDVSQPHLLTSLFRIFQYRANKLKNTTKFFTELSNCSSFCQSLSFVEWFSKTNKVIIPDSCKITSKQTIIQYLEAPNKKSNVIQSKTPPFIKKASLRLSLKAMIGKNPMLLPTGQSYKSKHTKDTDIEPNRLSKSNFEERNFTNSSVSESKPEHKDIFRQKIPEKLQSFHSFNFSILNHKNLQPNGEKTQSNTRKSAPTEPNLCPSKPIKKISGSFKSFGDIEDDEVSKSKQQQFYKKNQWHKSFNFLLDDTAVNSSVQLGEDVKKTQKSMRKLDRLDKIKQDMSKSYLNY